MKFSLALKLILVPQMKTADICSNLNLVLGFFPSHFVILFQSREIPVFPKLVALNC